MKLRARRCAASSTWCAALSLLVIGCTGEEGGGASSGGGGGSAADGAATDTGTGAAASTGSDFAVLFFDEEDGLWSWMTLLSNGAASPAASIYTQQPGKEAKLIGCVRALGATQHAIEIGAESVYASVFEDGRTTLLACPRR